MGMSCELKVVRIYRLEGNSKLKAFADVAVGEFIVKGVRIVEGKKGLFLSMPQEQAKDGKWYNSFYPSTEQAKRILTDVVLSAYSE